MQHLFRSGVTIAALVAVAAPAWAGLSQSAIVAPGGFVQAGCYSNTGGNVMVPGTDMLAGFGPPQDFHEQSFAGVSSAMQSASYSTSGISNSATARASMGVIRMLGGNTSLDESPFTAGLGNGGWKETFTITHPTLTGSGFLVFKIRCRGTMNVSGLTGSSLITTTGYKDNLELNVNSFFNPGGGTPGDVAHQRVTWGVASFGLPDSRTVNNDVATMAVPFTFGQPFTLGIYASSRASQRSSGGVGGTSHADLDLTIEWAGINGVYVGGAPIGGATINSGTTINWGAIVPACPGDATGNSMVGLDDVAAIITCWSMPAACNPSADLDGDGTIGLGDVAAVVSHWGAMCG